jgi:hypothetical protein
VAQSTVQRPAAEAADGSARRPVARGAATAAWLRRYPEPAVAAALVLASALIVVWARTRPSFDAYGWLVWGHQAVAGALNTNAAPSWKPLPFLFTAPYALFGHYELWLWMVTSLAVALSGVFFAGRIAYRVVADEEPGARRAGAWAAAVFAGAALLGIQDYWHYALSFQSDPMIISLCLGAVDCHLAGRPRWAFALGVLGALGRPEVWPFLALYTLWGWRYRPAIRWVLVGGWLFVLFMWFGIPAITSRTPFVAASNAFGSGRAPHGNKITATFSRFLDINNVLLEVVALGAVVLAVVRRDRTTLALAAGALVWVVVEIAFALHGWPGLGRYMFPAGAMVVVLAGVATGRLMTDVPWRWAGAVAAVVLAAVLVPSALNHVRSEHRDLRVQRARTQQIKRLSGKVSAAGGATLLRSCGEPLTRLEFQTILAWTLRRNVAQVGFKFGPAIASRRAIVLFTPTSHGSWVIQALHQRAAACRHV